MSKLSKIYLYAHVLFLIPIHVHALPSADVYWQRVSDGLGSLSAQKKSKLKDIIHKISSKEHELHADYHQVLTAQDSKFLAYQIIVKQIYELKHKLCVNNFEFLRPFNQKHTTKDIKSFLALHPDLLYFKNHPLLPNVAIKNDPSSLFYHLQNDTQAEIMEHLISVSLTLETKTKSDSALDVFKNGKGVTLSASTSLLHKLLLNIFMHEGWPQQQSSELIAKLLKQAPTISEGMITQIFIPKDQISKIAYVSHTLGFVKIKETQNIAEYFTEHEEQRDSKDFNPEVDDQLRILASGLKPGVVQMFRYTLLEDKQINDYEKFVYDQLINSKFITQRA